MLLIWAKDMFMGVTVAFWVTISVAANATCGVGESHRFWNGYAVTACYQCSLLNVIGASGCQCKSSTDPETTFYIHVISPFHVITILL